jgi:hypothetical protein
MFDPHRFGRRDVGDRFNLLLLGYWPLRRSQNILQEQLNQIKQYLAAQAPAAPAPVAPDVHAPAHKGKAK